MSNTSGMTPPLTPVLLAGMAVRPLPLAPLQPILKGAMNAIATRHPDVFERLSCLEDPVFLIDPTDLPFMFLLTPDPLLPELKAVRGDEEEAQNASANIRGPLLKLIELLEGETDGDALFFARDLVVEGDTEAVVALRNAVDGAEINVMEDVLSFLGPFARPAGGVAKSAINLMARAASDLEMLRNAAISPALRQSEIQAAKLKKLNEKVDGISRQSRRKRVKEN